jgi:hypothetical protein
MWHAWERREKCTRFWWENPKERDHSEDRGVDGRMGSEWISGRLTGSGVEWIQFGGRLCDYGDEPSGSGVIELVHF